MFVIKKIITIFIMPYIFSLAAVFAGIILILLKKREKTGKSLVIFGALSLTLFSFPPFVEPFLSNLENIHPKYDGSKVEFVVVLGGGHVTDNNKPLSSHLSTHSLTRLCEGIRILKLNKGSKLILSGWSGFYDKKSNAEVAKEVAVSLGVDPSFIITEPNPRDTIEESYYLGKIVGDRRFALVTSAFHMRRAAAIFKKKRLNFVPAPTYYYVKGRRRGFIPSPKTLSLSHLLVSEYFGYLWAKIKNEG